MPLRGQKHSDLVRDEAPYFKSLPELDVWFTRSHDKLSGVLPYQPRPHSDGSGAKLLVCHDYKGGYAETPSGLCYTFNFWSFCDTFVYFSHHRVTVPPSGWTNSAHKHGSRMLGTLIFEHDSDSECIQLISGRAHYRIEDNKIPISKRYATLLAELAYQRGFDGYLLNFESHLSSQTNHARALSVWILLLRAELQARVGSHSQVVWYDSVIYNGFVWHQNRLNGYNLPFFLASDTFFTNYCWEPETQRSMAKYFSNLQLSPDRSASTKTLQSIYSGVDVYGRGQYGDGGYSCYRAITYTAPLGFSTAIFAPGWTWESKTENPEQHWNDWWDDERRLWLGPLRPGEIIPVPPSSEGPFKPITAFFQVLSPPSPASSVFYTSFSPGVGYSWFVEGKKVLDTKVGWTDIDKQSSLGNLAWPWPTPSWQGAEQKEALFIASTALDMTDGYNGGNTLKLTFEYTGSEFDETIKSIWLPVQSLTVTSRMSFEARIVYKIVGNTDTDPDAFIYVKSASETNEAISSADLAIGQAALSALPQGWIGQTIGFTATSTHDTASVAVGFLLVFKQKKPRVLNFSLSLGQLAVYPTPPSPPVSIGTPSVTGARFTPTAHASGLLQGVLTWETTTTFTPIDVCVDDPESIVPAWLLQDLPAYHFPVFAYFNIYAESLPYDDIPPANPAGAMFIGTTGLDGLKNRFYVEQALFPDSWHNWGGISFYVQGVTDRGEVLPWERCAIA